VRCFYTVTGTDEAGNEGKPGEEKCLALTTPGPQVLPDVQKEPFLELFRQASPYLVRKGYRIPAGAILRVEDGVTIVVEEGDMAVDGELDVLGTTNSPVTLRPARVGIPRAISVREGGILDLTHTRIANFETAIDVQGGQARFQGLTCQSNARALRLNNAKVTAANCQFTKNNLAIWCNTGGRLFVRLSNFQENAGNLRIASGVFAQVDDNWWGTLPAEFRLEALGIEGAPGIERCLDEAAPGGASVSIQALPALNEYRRSSGSFLKLDLARRLIERDAGYKRPYLWAGEMLLKSLQYDEARRIIEKGLAVFPNDAGLLAALQNLKEDVGRRK
jgi:hypothetical protein